MSQKYRKGVFALLIDRGDNVLIIQKPNYEKDQWTIIGGGRSDGETKVENLFREIREETGLETDNFIVLGESSSSYRYNYSPQEAIRLHDGKYVGQSYSIFVLKLKSPKSRIKLDKSEISASRWVPIYELVKYLNFPGQYQNIKNAIEQFLN